MGFRNLNMRGMMEFSFLLLGSVNNNGCQLKSVVVEISGPTLNGEQQAEFNWDPLAFYLPINHVGISTALEA